MSANNIPPERAEASNSFSKAMTKLEDLKASIISIEIDALTPLEKGVVQNTLRDLESAREWLDTLANPVYEY
jgi:hypothetical protein